MRYSFFAPSAAWQALRPVATVVSRPDRTGVNRPIITRIFSGPRPVVGIRVGPGARSHNNSAFQLANKPAARPICQCNGLNAWLHSGKQLAVVAGVNFFMGSDLVVVALPLPD
jgi:hypothetical protein